MKDINYKIEISARHVHLSKSDFVTLFGKDAELTNVLNLSIVGEFKSDKAVTIVGPKRSIEKVSILGPFREKTQVEISVSDTYTLGIKDVPARLSNDLVGSAPVKLVGTVGELNLSEGLIVALRHIHMSKEDIKKFGLKVGQEIDITGGDKRAVTFHKVVVRESNVGSPIVHLDTDEGNAIK